MTSKLVKNVLGMATGLALASGFGSCDQIKNYEAKKMDYNGYEVVAESTGRKHLTMKDTSYKEGEPTLVASNYKSIEKGSGFNEIDSSYLPNGHPLNEYTNQDSLKKVYNLAMEKGKGFE